MNTPANTATLPLQQRPYALPLQERLPALPLHERLQALPLQERLQALLQHIGDGLLERDTAVRLSLLAALAGEHVLLIGPPGTAKSALARRLRAAFADATYFERLLTRFSTPEELFGPLSLKALEHDRYERLVEGFLPTAGIAFLDEVFKANSAILNALLTLLNERQFDNGTQRLHTPLLAVIAASNEVPSDETLQAFYDRFLVRVPVATVGDAAFTALLTLEEPSGTPAPPALSAEDCKALARAAAGVPLAPAFIRACQALRHWLAQRKASLSDRRWRQFVGLARMAAASEGRAEADALDLWLAPFVASFSPADVPLLQAWFVEVAAQAAPQAAPWLQRAVQAFEQQLHLEQQLEDDDGSPDHSAGKLALARTIGFSAGPTPGTPDSIDTDHGPEAGMLRIQSEALQASRRHRWSAVHVQARLDQVREVQDQVAAALQTVQTHAAQLQARLVGRLWMPAELQATLLSGPAQTVALLQDLLQRLLATHDGFAKLPQDTGLAGQTPAAVAWAAA
jgi:MoxR-like ATPase